MGKLAKILGFGATALEEFADWYRERKAQKAAERKRKAKAQWDAAMAKVGEVADKVPDTVATIESNPLGKPPEEK